MYLIFEQEGVFRIGHGKLNDQNEAIAFDKEFYLSKSDAYTAFNIQVIQGTPGFDSALLKEPVVEL